VVQPATILNRHTLNTEQGAMIPFYKVFTREKIIFIFLGKIVFILLHGLRPLILLKKKDMCTSLMVIRVTKIMRNSMKYMHTDLFGQLFSLSFILH
jgi:hypothetical protein